MGRTVARWFTALGGALLLLVGFAAIGAAAWAQQVVSSDDSLRTTPQVVQAVGCRTLLVEVAGASLQAEEVVATGRIGIEPESLLSITPEGEADSWLVGLAASPDIEARLLGTSYCLASESAGEWTSRSVSARLDDPRISLDGLQGLWARTNAGDSAILPIPVGGQTLVVAAGGDGELSDVRIEGIYRLVGASQTAYIGLIGGLITSGLGFLLLLVSIFGFRRRGRHESGNHSV